MNVKAETFIILMVKNIYLQREAEGGGGVIVQTMLPTWYLLISGEFYAPSPLLPSSSYRNLIMLV